MKKRFLTILLASLVACIAASLFGCGKTVEFKVDFMVDGSVYASVSTSGDEVIKMPNDPEKSGYVFDGWYWDEGTWQKPFTANSLLNEPLSSNMSVYAKWKGDKLTFKTLTVNEDNTVYGKVSNSQTTFSFLNEIEIVGKATFVVSTDIYGINQIPTKTVPLEIGDNTFYVTETIGNNIKLYTVTVRRRPFYAVTFNTNNGTFVGNQTIEEDSFATEPTTTRTGYTFTGWDYDFTQAITKNTTITAGWSANTNTAYKVEYYLENIDDADYSLYETESLQGTTDTTATAEIKTYDHFTIYKNNSILSGNVSGDGSLVLKVYYTRNTYTLSNANTSYGSITNAATKKYGNEIDSVATEYLGCKFLGWYNGEELLSIEKEYTFTIESNVTAKFKIKDEMSNFNFSSSVDTCNITDVKNKTIKSVVIPDYVTFIGKDAFYNCSGLESISVSIGNAKYHGTGNCLIETESKTLILGCKNSVIPTDSSVTSIDSFAFSGCNGLTSITIPDSVTSIGEGAFYNCSGLTSITIPDGVTSIGWYAFYNCSGLTSIEFKGTKDQWNAISKSYNWGYNTGNYTVYCTDGTISK